MIFISASRIFERLILYPRRESNPDYRFRKPMFYPLNYKGLCLMGLSESLFSAERHCRGENRDYPDNI